MEANEPMPDDKTAAAAFEAIPELVEHMLLALPLPDILLAQQVSQSWNTLIKNSPMLQRALFLRPSQDVQLTELANTYIGRKCHCCRGSKIIAQTACTGPYPAMRKPPRWVVDSNDNKDYRIVVNPFLQAMPWDPQQEGWRHLLPVGSFPLKVFPGASWRGMLITQPPIKEIVIWYKDYARDHLHKIHAKPRSAGITIGDLRSNANLFRNEKYAELFGSAVFNVIEPAPRSLGNRIGYTVFCTGKDVIFELEKNNASSGAKDSADWV